MRAVLQRVTDAQVRVDGEVIGQCGRGLMILVCAMRGDEESQAEALAAKASKCRIFPDEAGKMNRSLLDIGGEALVVSQFTLAADGRKGRRPSFDRAAPPEQAEVLYERFVARVRELGLQTATGRFGALMRVELVNDGPVTFVLEEPPGGPRV